MDLIFVIYKNEKYRIIYQYDSGYCEIKKDGSSSYNNVELVHISELTRVIEKSRTR